jgi:hypothetical protein
MKLRIAIFVTLLGSGDTSPTPEAFNADESSVFRPLSRRDPSRHCVGQFFTLAGGQYFTLAGRSSQIVFAKY